MDGAVAGLAGAVLSAAAVSLGVLRGTRTDAAQVIRGELASLWTENRLLRVELGTERTERAAAEDRMRNELAASEQRCAAEMQALELRCKGEKRELEVRIAALGST